MTVSAQKLVSCRDIKSAEDEVNESDVPGSSHGCDGKNYGEIQLRTNHSSRNLVYADVDRTHFH